jgi:hypothetical protein
MRNLPCVGWQLLNYAAIEPGNRAQDGQPPERSFCICERRDQASTVGAHRERGIAIETDTHAVRHATSRLCIHGPEPFLSLAGYNRVRSFRKTEWLTREWLMVAQKRRVRLEREGH